MQSRFDAIASPPDGQMAREQGSIGWVGLDVPLEIIDAAGCRPLRLDADASAGRGAAGFAEGGGHPWIRAAAGRILKEAGRLDAVVVGATPVQGVWLANFLLTLQRFGQLDPALRIEVCNISHLDRPSAVDFNRQSMRHLAERLGADPADLPAAIAGRNRVRAAQRRVEARRSGAARVGLAGSEARRLLDAADDMSAGAYVAMIESALARSVPADGLPVIYSGPGSADLRAYSDLEARGLRIVGDDADFGSRSIGQDVDPSAEPFEALATRYRRRSPAPAGWTTAERIAWLTGLVRDRAARAVVFDIPPWAHPAAWDFPAERRALETAGVRCLLLEEALTSGAEVVP